MKLSRFLILLALAAMYSKGAKAQSITTLFYDWFPNGTTSTVAVTNRNHMPLGSAAGNKEFGLGIRMVTFGSANNSIRFAMMANYRHIELNTANYRLPDSNSKIKTVEYMIGASYRPQNSTFRIGHLYSWFHATAMAGLGWSYNFDACLSTGLDFYPLKGTTENASGINIEFVYFPAKVVKSKNGAGTDIPYLYTINPSWCIRLGFVFNSHLRTSVGSGD
jgi:hypothetical protein